MAGHDRQRRRELALEDVQVGAADAAARDLDDAPRAGPAPGRPRVVTSTDVLLGDHDRPHSARSLYSARRCPSASPSPRSRRTPGRTPTRSTRSWPSCRPSSPARGHRVLVLAPSRSPELVRDSRRLIRAARDAPEALFDARRRGARARRRRAAAVQPPRPAPSPPVDVGRTVEEVLGIAPLDFVHVHEPFAPSTSSVALRHSRALNVGSFHAPTERVLSTQVARRFVELFFGRLDARTAAFDATRELMEHSFPAAYRLLRPGAAAVDREQRAPARSGPLRIAFCAQEERAALRLFLRALRRLPDDVDWRGDRLLARPARRRPARCAAACATASRSSPPTRRPRTRCSPTPTSWSPPRSARRPRPGLLVRALGAGAVPVAARLRAYEELLGDGDLGLRFEPGDVDVLAGQLERLVARPRAAAPGSRDGVAARATGSRWDRVADEAEAIYARARRAPPRPTRATRAARAAAQAPADRRRPAHAHRPLARLRDAGRRAARRPRASAGSARSP